jgi:predicted amidohydrolase YtcJ
VRNLLVVNGEVEGRPGVDVRLEGGCITDVGVQLERGAGEVVDAAGGAVLPGLHDHHVHLRALAAAEASVALGPPAVTDRAALAKALRAVARSAPPDTWIRGIGYHESVAGTLDASDLDDAVADRPVRVQHRSGALWVLNTAGLRQARIDESGEAGVERDAAGRPTGRLWRLDRWLRERVPPIDSDLAGVGRRAAAQGITGFTDADPDRSEADVGQLSVLPQRVHLMGPPGLRVDCGRGRTLGPVKVILDDDTLPSPETLAATARAAHAEERGIAVHCVTRAQLVVTVAALWQAGTIRLDRIEHAAVVPDELVDDLRVLGVTVVTQPGFVAERGDDYRKDVDPDDLPLLYRCRSLLDAGVRVAAGTDAPFGGSDPWRAVRAAVDRRTSSGAVLGAEERLEPGRALDLFLGAADQPATRRHVRLGAPADLCVLCLPLAAAASDPSSALVQATVIDGTVAYRRSQDP